MNSDSEHDDEDDNDDDHDDDEEVAVINTTIDDVDVDADMENDDEEDEEDEEDEDEVVSQANDNDHDSDQDNDNDQDNDQDNDNDNDIDNDNDNDNETTATPVPEEQYSQENGATTPVPSEAASEVVVVADDDDEDDDEVLAAVVVLEEGTDAASASARKRRKPGPKPKRKRMESDRQEAAKEAQAMLRHTVQRLPVAIGEAQVVRSLGRVYPQDDRFSNNHHIYPVGFSCDRYEFSPVHGRSLKLRCTILDAAKVRAKQKELGVNVTAPSDGPLFRIMWGGGIDDESEAPIEYPYDVDIYSAAVTTPSRATPTALSSSSATTTTTTHNKKALAPAEGMRVRVKYEREQWYSGTIIDVEDHGKGETEISIQYDDGSLEHANYPDPDISLCMPGNEDEAVENGKLEVSEVNGKSVTTIIGNTAMEAWGNALIAMGLIDEITFKKALGAVKATRDKANEDVAQDPNDDNDDDEEEREDETEEENDLRQQIEDAKEELDKVRAQSREACVDLAGARLSRMGPFFCNPFQDKDSNYSQQMSWLTTVIRKEKTKMGSTGNKKKIVTAIDLLERNNTFFNTEIESLVEGLPGAEQLTDYVFHSFRFGFTASVVSEAWHQQAHLRQAHESKKRKISDARSVKSAMDSEKEAKRRKREEEKDARARQRQEELEEKKRARAEDRMARLNVQVEERLFKEACFQREKVVAAMAKAFTKECSRRKKAAELVAMQSVVDDTDIRSLSSGIPLPELSPLCQVYDEDVLRCWDFVASYGESLVQWGYIEQVPTLISLQQALDGLRHEKGGQVTSKSQLTRAESIEYLTNLCVALCKPLAVSLTRLLFASLIALNPALQKDFGAAFFAEVRTNANKEEAEGPSASDLLPVNKSTWQEVARLAFLADALGELGNAKHEIAHLLRGYRSMGHPNSKEAKRLRRTEDFPIAVLRQVITRASAEDSEDASNETKVRILVPSRPSADSCDWQFYIHNVKGLNVKKMTLIKRNLEMAINLAKKSGKPSGVAIVADMEKALSAFTKIANENEPTSSEISACNKAKISLLRLLEKVTGETYASNFIKEIVHREKINSGEAVAITTECPDRVRESVRFPKELSMNEKLYKERLHDREEYMADALRLKEEMENQGEEDDDDDDEEDENDTKESEPQKSKPEETPTESEEAGSEEQKKEPAEGEDQPENNSGKKGTTEVVAIVVENGDDTAKHDIPAKIGKLTPYDDFSGDIPTAPELIRRCLAVLRTVCQTNAADPFVYPVDPQTNPGYYEAILQPMCLREVGKVLMASSQDYTQIDDKENASTFVEGVVAQFARNVRVIAQNCSCYPNAGATIIAAGDELLRVFERLMLDWVLAPRNTLPSLEDLDDDKCVEFHESDEDSLVLLCDGCEGKYNMGRLSPPLRDVPKGDWFCPRCLSGRCWPSLDTRIGKSIMRAAEGSEKETWTVERSSFIYPKDSTAKPVLMYHLKSMSGTVESVSLGDIDELLKAQGEEVEAIACVEAISESLGYSQGANRGLYENLVPVPANPSVSDSAAQAFTSSSAYQDTIIGSSTLMLNNPEDLKATEWSRLLTLLVMKCASSEMMNSLASKLEGDAAEKMAKVRNGSGRVDIQDLLPLPDDQWIDEIPKQSALPVKQEEENSNGGKESGDAMAVVVDANAIEVVEDVDLTKANSSSMDPPAVDSNGTINTVDIAPDPVVSEETERKLARVAICDEKDKRYKLREESIAALSIKNQLRSTFSSFEEDTVSLVIDNSLGSKERGLNLTSTRCRGMTCDLCGLSDTALGSPLLRVPNMLEWYELMPHVARNRRVFLLADVKGSVEAGKESAPPTKLKAKKDVMAVKIMIGGELFSCVDDEDHFEGITDGGMMECLPRNEEGCQYELNLRDEANLPFVTGSLSAHQCCAVSAHTARKERVVSEHKAKREMSVEQDAGILCGRTLSLGRDSSGRTYWKFNADKALFVSVSDDTKTWHRYSDPEVIASILHGLVKEPIAVEIKQAFPEAARLLRGRKWSQMLLKRQFSKSLSLQEVTGAPMIDNKKGTTQDDEQDEPYQAGEDVLVESKCGQMLWDGKVVAVSQKDDQVNGYRVSYKGWSSRFDEWVGPFRVVEPIENNISIQQDMVQELRNHSLTAPEVLKKMIAKKHLNSKDRARDGAKIPEFANVTKVPPSASSSEKAFALAKAALLMIEAALPHGAIDNSPTGAWRPGYAAEWRKAVQRATGPYTVMACAFMLEENIDPEWIDPHAIHLLSSLPQRWKSIREANVSGLSLRIAMLDQGVQYATVDRLKYVSKSRK